LAQQTGEGSAANLQVRASIAANADVHVGQTGWRPSDPPVGVDKCSQFVADMIHDGGGTASFKPDDGPARAPLAGEWLNPHASISGWRALKKGESPQPGDVVAEAITNVRVGATGHVGIVTSVGKGGQATVAASDRGPVYRTHSEFTSPPNVVTYHRYIGQ
jgi:uncharacterized protein YgiM (DUF1202 family)